ncbi:Undecaprenyl-diphosphatase [Oligella ureolytica]|uniref:Undecaprenyl-diphosphatase n=1 Tax=Oligella ureolytica TaxID=90244 RepID=A0A378XIS1_9BURK|nr:undecaprenyl-diphosphate phosphatase [Oligella ureolytica]QPT39790.1 undecaprenyl-diphosphate phosphatase [Oligella ureolytica]SUA52156.1 Undecaprenyl-diphosphatase [Oligella ureolytica]SUA57560.1 Undecaprenyl-diphosphatase [Oligella ureolytica]
MDFLYLLKAAILGIVEGLSEFLPISSTAHLIIWGDWLNFNSGDVKVFEIVIQFGSIMAVVWIYRHYIIDVIKGLLRWEMKQVLFVRNLLLAFLPAAIIGLLIIDQVAKLLDGKFMIYVFTLIVGGFIMLWVESRPQMKKANQLVDENAPPGEGLDSITWKQALVVGFAQCLAMVPGTSRSGATIISGMIAGIPRRAATEFSFFLAMPTMLAATVLSLYKYGDQLSSDNMLAIVVGFVFAFISALFLVKAILRFVSKRSYKPFAFYRIVFGVVVGLWAMGYL